MRLNPTQPAGEPGRAAQGRSHNRLRMLSSVVRTFVLFGATALLANVVFAWCSPSYALDSIKMQSGLSAPIHPPAARTLAFYALWEAAWSAVLIAALFRLWELFGEYSDARIFSSRALASLRGFARWMLLAAILSPISTSVLSIIATWENGPSNRKLNLMFSTQDYLMLLFGLVVLGISTVMAEAGRLAEENEGFV